MFNPHLYPGSAPDAADLAGGDRASWSGSRGSASNQALQRLEQAGLLRIEYGGDHRHSICKGLREFEG